MSLVRVLTPAPSRRLCPVATVRDYLGVGSGEDKAIGVKLDVVSQRIEALFERQLARQGYEERLAGRGGHFLALSRWPIESVSTLEHGISSPLEVDATTYSIAGDDRARLYRALGWCWSADVGGQYPAGGQTLSYRAEYVAGWLLPDQVSTWSAAGEYSAGAFARPTTANVLRFEATTAGTTAGTEPTWPDAAGETVADGTVVWTAREATELPEPIRHAAMLAAADLYRGGGDVPTGIKSESSDGGRIEYFSPSEGGRPLAFSRTVMHLLEVYR